MLELQTKRYDIFSQYNEIYRYTGGNTDSSSVSIFIFVWGEEEKNEVANLHAKRVQKWPCTAERDETVQWAAANLVNDVRQSSFKYTQKKIFTVN